MAQKACEFCKIVEKENDASIIFEDERTMAFLWTKAIAEGHTLVIPKVHYENIYGVPEDEIAHLFKIVKRVAVAVKKGLNADGINIGQNNERAADQTIFHLHVHVLPRFEGQKLPADDKLLEVNREKREETANKIRATI
jgi:histidine triad (HIT) family protein